MSPNEIDVIKIRNKPANIRTVVLLYPVDGFFPL